MIVGDVSRATRPTREDGTLRPLMIAHVVSDVGRMGSGVAKALYERWPTVRASYLAWAAGQIPGAPALAIGAVQPVQVEPETWVLNCCAMHGIGYKTSGRRPDGQPPLDMTALATCFEKVAALALRRDAAVHVPRLGALRGGGDWAAISALIDTHWVARGVDVTVYRWPFDPPDPGDPLARTAGSPTAAGPR